MLNPHLGRVRILQDPSGLTVTIPSKKNLFILGFGGFWLIGWAFGEVTVIGSLLSSQAGADLLFLLGWLGAWTVGGLTALVVWLWFAAGMEHLDIRDGQVELRRSIPLWTRVLVCELDQISNLRVDTTPPSLLASDEHFPPILKSKGAGRLSFSYGVHDISFGDQLDIAEASKVAQVISAAYPQFSRKL